jgi:DNA-binding response OmpR family regulator
VQTILIVDSDLGFVFWLGQALFKVGFEVFPAKAVPDALTLLSECVPALDLLIINFSLPGAPDFVTALRLAQDNVKVIALVKKTEPSPEYYPVLEAVLSTDDISTASRTQYVSLIQDVMLTHERTN